MSRRHGHLEYGSLLPALTLFVAMLGLGACSSERDQTEAASTPERAGAPFRVVTTTAMIADIVANVAGQRAEVTSLMGPGVDPHLYQPTRSDISRLLEADVVFYNGLNLEGKMTDTFVRVARANPHVFAVTDGIQMNRPEYLLAPPGFAGHYDPHVWMDVKGWMEATGVVVDALGQHDRAGEATYRANGDRYLETLRELDDYARRIVTTIPADRRVLITAHDAFNYFARAYGVEVEGIQGLSTESQAGLKRIEQLVAMLVERNIAAVFVETSVSEKNVRALVEGALARGHDVSVGGSLFSDAMGAPGTYEGTYLGMIDHNATTIVRALGGEAPAAGLHGRLSHVR